MATPSETIALVGLILLNIFLFYANLRQLIRGRPRPPRQHQQQKPLPQPPGPAAAPGDGEGEDRAEEDGREKQPQQQRRRRRARRKRQQEQGEGESGGGGDGDGDSTAAAPSGKAPDKEEEEEALLRRPQFPLASVAGALQRRINERYDDLARASEEGCLTIEQIMELSAMEMEAPEISFEELLAKEKEDTAFWQPNGKPRSASTK
nr:unnamed protein product [Digitaria exilis]